METRLPSTSLLRMGKRADFWRARVTGLSMAYWKKSPSLAADATEDTPELSPRFIGELSSLWSWSPSPALPAGAAPARRPLLYASSPLPSLLALPSISIFLAGAAWGAIG